MYVFDDDNFWGWGRGCQWFNEKEEGFFEKYGIYKDYVVKYQCIVYVILLECI